MAVNCHPSAGKAPTIGSHDCGLGHGCRLVGLDNPPVPLPLPSLLSSSLPTCRRQSNIIVNVCIRNNLQCLCHCCCALLLSPAPAMSPPSGQQRDNKGDEGGLWLSLLLLVHHHHQLLMSAISSARPWLPPLKTPVAYVALGVVVVHP